MTSTPVFSAQNVVIAAFLAAAGTKMVIDSKAEQRHREIAKVFNEQIVPLHTGLRLMIDGKVYILYEGVQILCKPSYAGGYSFADCSNPKPTSNPCFQVTRFDDWGFPPIGWVDTNRRYHRNSAKAEKQCRGLVL